MGRKTGKVRDPGLQQALDRCGGPSGLARKIGKVSAQAVSQWARCPGTRALDVARASGVPPEALRPDLYANRPRQTPDAVPPTPAVDPARPFSFLFHLRRGDFANAEEVDAHLEALREEWGRR